MNSYSVQGHSATANEYKTGPMQMPGMATDVGAIGQAMQQLHREIDELNEQISALSERLAPVSTGRPVASSIGGNEEKQGPASKHAESLRELQQMVRSCRNRINVISSQLDI